MHILCWLLFSALLCAFLAVVIQLLPDIDVSRLLIAAYCLLTLRKFFLRTSKVTVLSACAVACAVPPLNGRTTQKWQMRTKSLLLLLFTASSLPTNTATIWIAAAVLRTVLHAISRCCLHRRSGNNAKSMFVNC